MLARFFGTAVGLCGAPALIALVALPRTAAARDRETFQLDYAAAEDTEGCPDAAGLRAKIAARLGYDPFADGEPHSPSRTIVTRMRKAAGHYQSRIEIIDAAGKVRGRREIEASTCADLAASTSYAVAVAIDPEEARNDHEAPPGPVVPGSSSPLPPPPPPPAPTTPVPNPPRTALPPPDRPPVPWVPSIFLGIAGAALGPQASVAPGGIVGIHVQRGALGLGLEGRAFLPTSRDVAPGSVRTNVMGVSPVLCAHVEGAAFCAKAFLGAFQGAAEGVAAPEKRTTFFSTVGVHASYTLRPFQHSGFGVGVHLGSDLVLTRTRVNFRGQEVWSTSALSIESSIRGSYAFF